MPGPAGAARAALALVALEPRDTPATLFTFDTPGASPGPGWAEWSADGRDVFAVAAGAGAGGTPGLVSDGTSLSTGRAWRAEAVAADTAVSVRVRLDRLKD